MDKMFLTLNKWAEKEYYQFIETSTNIPADDVFSYSWTPRHYKWIYNKLELTNSQAVGCGLHGIVPDSFPIISKPLINLHGLSNQVKLLRKHDVIADDGEYGWRKESYSPGHFWMYPLTGVQRSTDIAMRDGKILWLYTMRAVPDTQDSNFHFSRFETDLDHSDGHQYIPIKVKNWVRENLSGYTGCLNIEYIGDIIIDVHTRFSDQFLEFYGDMKWLAEVVNLYNGKSCYFEDIEVVSGCSRVIKCSNLVPESTKKNLSYQGPGLGDMNCSDYNIYSFHILKETPDDELDSAGRLAIVNAKDHFTCQEFVNKIIKEGWFA